jgi:hypothetical protein
MHHGLPIVTRGVTQKQNRQLDFSAKSLILLVPVERIELPTFGLQNRCSTAELNRRTLKRSGVRRDAGSDRALAARIPDSSAKDQNPGGGS